jgi:hypothetical protein
LPLRNQEAQPKGLFFKQKPTETDEKWIEREPQLANVCDNESAIFFQRFLRSYRLLDFIACRVLGDEKRATIAIQHCWRIASRNPPAFEYEGAFRSWLVRVLIDEAQAILCENQDEKEPSCRERHFLVRQHATNRARVNE